MQLEVTVAIDFRSDSVLVSSGCRYDLSNENQFSVDPRVLLSLLVTHSWQYALQSALVLLLPPVTYEVLVMVEGEQ